MFDPGEMGCRSLDRRRGLSLESCLFRPCLLLGRRLPVRASVFATDGLLRRRRRRIRKGGLLLGVGELVANETQEAAATARPKVPEPWLRQLLVRLLADAPEDGAPPLRSALLRVAAALPTTAASRPVWP